MKNINLDDFRVVNKINLLKTPTELKNDTDDYKNEELNQI
jgi:hypothetical protein